MIISFSNTPLVLAFVVGALILASHLTSVLISRLSRVFIPVGIALHLCLFVLLFFAGASFDLTALCFMASLFVYTSLSFFIKRKTADEGVEEGEV